MNALNLKRTNPLIALFCALVFISTSNSVSANTQPGNTQSGTDALRIYYSDLYQKLSVHDITDVPFAASQITVKSGDSLLAIARQYRITELDSYHLAAAIYEINKSAFTNGDAARLPVGAKINLPNIGDLIFAQDRYEKLKVTGRTVNFNHQHNQMQAALRWPFGKPLLLKDSAVTDRQQNRIATLTDYQLDKIGGDTPRPQRVAKASANTTSTTEIASAASTSAVTIAPADNIATSDTVADADSQTTTTAQQNTSSLQNSTAQGTQSTRTHSSETIVASVSHNNTHAVTAPTEPFYLGPPRNASAASTDNPSDPLSYTVEWDFNSSTSVGTALGELADYIGYELVTEHHTVIKTLSRPLPGAQRRISGVSAEQGFDILAGRGLKTVFDHVSRSIHHQPKEPETEATVTTAATEPTTATEATEATTVTAATKEPEGTSATVATAETEETDEPVAAAAMAGTEESTVQSTPIVNGKYDDLLAHTGITGMLQHFPTDMLDAAQRHAERCGSKPVASVATATQLQQLIVDTVKQNSLTDAVDSLVQWYDSPTGKLTLQLEQGAGGNAGSGSPGTSKRRIFSIEQVYQHTVTGHGISAIAVALDYAGWSLSGCKQHAQQSGNNDQLHSEMRLAENIINKQSSLESGLREDMLAAMADQYATLSDTELAEYAVTLQNHSILMAELRQAVLDAVDQKTIELSVSLDY